MWQEKGFYREGEINLHQALTKLHVFMDLVTTRYPQFTVAELLQAPAPGKWSRQQLLGHLVDSALNNLKRFTDAQLQPDEYTLIAYDQDGLVAFNHYQTVPLTHLLQLWESLNRQIVYVAEKIPAAKLAIRVRPQYKDTGVQTLGWLICDYVAHMEHHLLALGLLS